MQISAIQLVLIFIVSALAGMESVLDEFQFHRPLIACTLTGLVLGDLRAGIILGGSLELIALGWMNIGAAQSPDSALASVIATILVVIGGQDTQAGIAIALPVAVAGQVLTVIVRTITVAFQHAADRAAEDAAFNKIIFIHFSALIMQAMRVAIPATVVAAFADANAVKTFLDSIPSVITGGLAVAGGMIVVVGYAMVLNMMSIPYLMPFFYLGFVVAGYLDFSLLAFGAIGLIAALLYVQLNPNFNKGAGVQQVVADGTSTVLADDELED